jgi:hypothetical protein
MSDVTRLRNLISSPPSPALSCCREAVPHQGGSGAERQKGLKTKVWPRYGQGVIKPRRWAGPASTLVKRRDRPWPRHVFKARDGVGAGWRPSCSRAAMGLPRRRLPLAEMTLKMCPKCVIGLGVLSVRSRARLLRPDIMPGGWWFPMRRRRADGAKAQRPRSSVYRSYRYANSMRSVFNISFLAGDFPAPGLRL